MARNVSWNLPTTFINSDKSVVRTGVKEDYAHELVGFDGGINGGLRVFPGFLKIHDFDPANEVNNPNTYNGKFWETIKATGATGQDVHPWAGSAHTRPTDYKVVQHFPVSFKVGARKQAFGFVYKVTQGYGVTPGTDDNVTASIHIDYWITGSDTVYTRELRRGVDPDAQMDVTVMGRFVFIFIRGAYPLLFHIKETATTLKFKSETITEVNPSGTARPFANVGAFGQLWQSVQTLDTTNYIAASAVPATTGFSVRLKLKDWTTEGNASRADDLDIADVLADEYEITDLSVFLQQQAVLGAAGSQVPPFSDDYVGMEGTMGFRFYTGAGGGYPDYAGGATPEGVDTAVPIVWTLTEVNWDLTSVSITATQARGEDFTIEGGWYLGATDTSAEIQVDQIYLEVTFLALEEVCVGGVASESFPGPGEAPILTPYDKTPGGYSLGGVTVPDGPPANAQFTVTATGPTSIAESSVATGEYPGDRPQEDTDLRQYAEGDYAISYMLLDAETDRKSAISNFAPVSEGDFATTPRYFRIEVVWDSSKFDTMLVFRSPRTQGVGTLATAALQMQEARVTLADYQVNPAPASPHKRAVVYFSLEDKELVFQEPYPDRPVFDQYMPPGGAGFNYESTILVSATSKTSADDEETQALGELRWSALGWSSPENFAPGSYYLPKVPSSEIIRFLSPGTNVIACARDRNYRLRKESVYFKVDGIHRGFGIVGPRAGCEVGQTAYIVTRHGVKSVSDNGDFEDVLGLNYIVLEQWQGFLQNIYCAFDPSLAAIFIHNADLKHSAILWFNTGKITELVDCPWLSVETAFWPDSPLVTYNAKTNPFAEQATFLHSHGSGTTGKYRLYVVDRYRQRTISGGASATTTDEKRVTLLDIGTGDSRFVASVITDNMDGTADITLTGGNMPQRPEGAMLYFIGGSAEGVGVEILSVASNVVTVDNSEEVVGIAAANDRVCISPVKTRIIFSQAGYVREDNADVGRNYFTVRHIDALGCHFTDVEDSYSEVVAAALDPSYAGALYVGNESDFVRREFPRDTYGAKVAAMENREGTYYVGFGTDPQQGAKFGYEGSVLFPSIETYVSDVDFRLIGCVVKGTIVDSERTRLPS